MSASKVPGSPSGQRFGVDDLQGVIAVPPTPALPGADRLAARDTVDLAETDRMVRTLLDSGVDGVLLNGTLGEIATLTLEEWRAFVATVAETVRQINADFPVFAGATTSNSRDTAERIRYVQDLGLRGAFLGRPSWSQLGADAIATFYEDLAAEFPQMSFVLYDNPEAFKGPIPPPVYARLARIPGVIGVKYPSVTPKFRSDVGAVGGGLRIMPIEADWLAARTLFPEEMLACWSSSALCGPEPVLFLREAIRGGDVEAARWVTDRIEWTYETFLARRDFAEFSKYNTRIEKLRFDEAGYVSAGPARPPYHVVPEAYVEGARETGRRWRQVVDEVDARGEGAGVAVGSSSDQAKEER